MEVNEIMKVQELKRAQLEQLKVDYVFRCFEERDETPSYWDIAQAVNIDDEVIFNEYGHIDFVEEDFYNEEN
jgi:hypothetical protein